ncbi:MAG: c-type cytochrome [Gemmatimonadaceae bacterium]|nr:c-type cytochrome [Gemmatimonadaceae bacterium]
MSPHVVVRALAIVALSAACVPDRLPESLTTEFAAAERALFAPLPVVVELPGQPATEAQVSLGRALFHEPLLSDGHDVSCNSCHALNAWGTDGRRVSLGHDGRAGTRNAPTEYNAAGHLAQFWDGRARDVEAQANGPILNPIEVGMPDSAAVLAHLRASPMYVAAFRAAFPAERDPISYDNAGRAIGAFERGLVTPAPWDRFLAGDSTAFTTEQRRGLRSFLNAGCQSCHAGINVGGDRFMKAGLINAWPCQADSGRYHVTNNPNDRFLFKVPSLRNIANTGPYFHDGSVADLSEAVRMMAHHQLGKDLTPEQVRAIVAYLGSLTGTLPLDYIAYPQKPR